MNKLKNKKGFTLVEVIAVLVILAILIAIAIPAVNGYIKKAKGTEYDLTARNVYMAATIAINEYAVDHTPTEINTYATGGEDSTFVADVLKLTSLGVDEITTGDAGDADVGKYSIDYTDGNVVVYYLVTGAEDEEARTYPALVTGAEDEEAQ
ncbi:MAG: prepilin-type N-terminal cleavage/methylation domain-containing protein [Eubacteriaceae bacterium]|nr:prepilin-type N-terminal cleavage/methylation domain-containing protein [Eubacteriaceae bacterium]